MYLKGKSILISQSNQARSSQDRSSQDRSSQGRSSQEGSGQDSPNRSSQDHHFFRPKMHLRMEFDSALAQLVFFIYCQAQFYSSQVQSNLN